MSHSSPPRLALWLLTRFVDDHEPLAGDLAERYRERPSRLWFWWQVLGAIAVASTRPREVRPLRLVDGPAPFDARRVRHGGDRRAINLTASPIYGVGGLSLVGLASIVTVTAPGTWWIALGVLFGSVLVGLTRLAVSHRRRRSRD